MAEVGIAEAEYADVLLAEFFDFLGDDLDLEVALLHLLVHAQYRLHQLSHFRWQLFEVLGHLVIFIGGHVALGAELARGVFRV